MAHDFGAHILITKSKMCRVRRSLLLVALVVSVWPDIFNCAWLPRWHNVDDATASGKR
jgi:hypothetical protein